MKIGCIGGIILLIGVFLCPVSNAAPDCTATGDLSNVCAGTTGLTASVPTQPSGTVYLWSISANGTITGPNNQPAVTYSADTAGLLTLTVHVTDPFLVECEEDYSFTVYSNPTANILANGVATSYAHACNGVNLNLNGSPSGGSGSWSQHLWTGSGATYLNSTSIVNPVFNSTVPGTYSLTYRVTDTHTCQAEDSITIEVHMNPVCDILVEGVSSPTAAICSNVDLALDGNPSGGSGSFVDHAWTGSGAVYLSNPDIRNPVFNATIGGSFALTYTATDSYGCMTSDNLTVNVTSSPLADIQSNGVSTASDWLCLGESTALDANPTGGSGVYTSHAWTGDTLPLSAVNIPDPTFMTSNPGIYSLTYTVIDANGCFDVDTITIQVENPVANILANGNPVSVFETCASVTVNLNGNPTGGSGGNSHLWTGDYGPLSNRFIRNPTFNTSVPGVYNLVYTVTDDEGCSATDSISITVHPNPVVDILIEGFPLPSDWLCMNEPVNLDGNPSGGSNIYVTHLWTGSGASRLNNPNIQNPVFQSSTTGNYSLTYRVTDSRGCIRTDTITIRVANPIPEIEANGYPAATYTACAGSGVILNGNPKNGSHVYVTHTWTGDTAYLDRTDIQAPIFNAVTLGTYNLQYTVVDDETCPGSDSIQITVVANPIANAGADNLVLFGESTVLDASASSCSGGCQYLWEVESGDMNSIDDGHDTAICTVSPERPTVYRVTVTDTAGCTDSDVVVITVGAIPVPATTRYGLVMLLALTTVLLIRFGRKSIGIQMLLVLFAVTLTPLISVSPACAQATRFVNPASPSPGSPYGTWQTAGHTIQAVVNACSTGDTVYVANGIYPENILLNKDITLRSWCLKAEDCVIQAPVGTSPAMTIDDPDPSNHMIVVAGFRFQGGSRGIYIDDNAGTAQIPLVRNCIIDGYSIGIQCESGALVVEFCTIADNDVGFFANDSDARSSAFFNIISGNSQYGLQIDASYFQMRNNCYFDNGQHIFGAPNAYCDEWSLLTMPSGVDPMFVPGTFTLDPASPCRDFIQIAPYTACNNTLFDQDESPFDLGAYGGYGSYPIPPAIDESSLDPEPGDFRIPANYPITFRLEDFGSAGLDLNSLSVTVRDHGHPAESFTIADITAVPIPQFGAPPQDCLAMGYDLTLPGTAHDLFGDFANVRVEVTVSDRCPQPNSTSFHWEFFADDLNPPVLLPGFYPGNGAVGVPVYGPIEMDIYDAGVGVDTESMSLTLNGDPISLNLSEITWTGNHLTMIPRPRFIPGQSNTLTFTIADFYGNPMPVQTITFTCSADTDLPFVPGVTGPAPSPGNPVLAPEPIPAPGSDTADVTDPISFSFQDFSTIVDLTTMQVTIHSGSSTYRYYFESQGGSSRVFQVSGDPQARRITCWPVGGWVLGSAITVTITGGKDTAAPPNTMATAFYSFTCATAPLPAMSTWGMILLPVLMGIVLLVRRR